MSNTFGTVVGIDEHDNKTKMYRVLVAMYNKSENGQIDWKFNCTMMTESQVFSSLNMGKVWSNIKIENGKIKGSSGSLERFKDTKHKPFVILSQIVSADNKLLGYKVANYDGGVKNVPLKEMLAYGNRATKQGSTPVQNAIFIPADADRKEHYKSYPGCSFIIEVLAANNKNKHSEVKKINTVKNEKTLSKLDEIYNKEQIEQLKLGKAHGVDIRIYANPALSAKQMKVLREGLEKKVNVRPVAHPEFSELCMAYYIMEMKNGIDIRKILNPKYNLGQLNELTLAVEEGLDVSKMSNPKLSAEEMSEIRERLESKIWKDELVRKDGTWK